MTPEAKQSIRDRLVLRPVTHPEDDAFLRELYFATRGDLGAMPVPEELKRDLLLMQYDSQTVAYAQQYPNASHEIVEIDDRPVGRLMIDRRPRSVCIVDISLIPERRNEGIGTSLLRQVMDECSEKELACELQVVVSNPARRLYERLGFREEDNDGVRLSMRWTS